MRIYGAGLAGLLCGIMLRRYKPEIHELQSSLPNNHNALLRFRSDAVSRVTGIPFRRVRVFKAIKYLDQLLTTPNMRLSNMYSFKVTGEVIERSILDLEPVDRFIAPEDLIQQMADGLNIHYGSALKVVGSDEPAISTIPMPFLMEMAGWKQRPNFNYRAITSITCEVVNPKINVYQTIYCPDSNTPWYRSTFTGNKLTIEMVGEHFTGDDGSEIAGQVVRDFGLPRTCISNVKTKVQRFGKIAPIDNEARREFILGMSDMHKIYSVGRYATWRNILLDDVVHDISIVEQFITQRDKYKVKLLQA